MICGAKNGRESQTLGGNGLGQIRIGLSMVGYHTMDVSGSDYAKSTVGGIMYRIKLDPFIMSGCKC